MGNDPASALYQSFLPASDEARAHVWKFSWQYGGRRPRHFHAEPELNLMVAGSATFGVAGRVISASAGEVLGFPPGLDHFLLETSPDVHFFAIGVDPKLSSEILRGDKHDAFATPKVRLTESDFNALLKRAEAIVDLNGIDQLGAELWEHANWVRHRRAMHVGPSAHVLTRRTLSLIVENPALGRDAMARSLRATPTAISRYFHRDLGMTLVQYRTRLRLMRLIDRVDDGRANLESIAKSVGFGSYSQCSRAFQMEFKCSPRQFFSSELRQSMQTAYEPDTAAGCPPR